ncbi:MAG: hypothetical protein GY765_04785 [bacterium]|nr:hypothetical protein [bacterium]
MKKLSIMLFVMLVFLSCLEAKTSRFGVGVKAGVFGIPNQILDVFIYEHPEVKGESYAFEIRSYGSKGPKSVFSGIYAFEYSTMRGEGPWRDEKNHRSLNGVGEIEQYSLTATIIMSLFPSSSIHPYIGAGLGIGRIDIWYEGTYTDDVGTQVTEDYGEKRFIPVAHVPIGVKINLNERFEIRLEGGFKNGFYLGGGLAVNF